MSRSYSDQRPYEGDGGGVLGGAWERVVGVRTDCAKPTKPLCPPLQLCVLCVYACSARGARLIPGDGNDTELEGKRGRLELGVDAHLFEDVVDVGAHGVGAEDEDLADVFIRVAA
jgi:hypothetical protein